LFSFGLFTAYQSGFNSFRKLAVLLVESKMKTSLVLMLVISIRLDNFNEEACLWAAQSNLCCIAIFF
jgi:hypothetical protein